MSSMETVLSDTGCYMTSVILSWWLCAEIPPGCRPLKEAGLGCHVSCCPLVFPPCVSWAPLRNAGRGVEVSWGLDSPLYLTGSQNAFVERV